jgi:hypothetical protein
MKKVPVIFSVTVIVHDGSRARQALEGHCICLDVRLGCSLVCTRRKVLFALPQQRFNVAQTSIDVARSARAPGVAGLV